MTFDRLPTTQELKFRQEYKVLYLRLSTVIRSLSTKFENPAEIARVRCYAEFLHPSIGVTFHAYARGQHSERPYIISCIVSEISNVVSDFQLFTSGMEGGKRAAKKADCGITRLEYLRDNWDELTVTGDAVRGYELVRQPTES